MNTGYNSTSDIYQWLQGAAPVSTGFAEMLAPLVGAMTGVDVMPVLNMLRFNRQDRPFYEADWSMSRQMRDRFRNMTAGEPSSTTRGWPSVHSTWSPSTRGRGCMRSGRAACPSRI